MENSPRYEIGQKVWFLSENKRFCYGAITVIRPVNYDFNYDIKLKLDSVGEVMKNAIWEDDILGDFTDSLPKISYEIISKELSCEIDNQIVKSLINEKYNDDNKLNCDSIDSLPKEVLDCYSNKYATLRMATVEPLYEFGLERDFGVKCDLAFILGAIKKYGRIEGCYSDLAGYMLRMAMQMVEDMREDVNKEKTEEAEKNEQSTR